MLIAETIFWSSLLFIFYAYFGYLILLITISLVRNREVKKQDITPKVSFIIAAYNEEKRIAEKIENTLKQDYPKSRLEIIVISDCSTDRTDEIVKSYESNGVKLVRVPVRKGKENAQKHAADIASGEILIFSDVATTLNPYGIRNIVKNFSDPTVGCVSSIDRFINPDGGISGEGIYVRYEMLIRKLETKVNTLVGLSGSFFAVKREVCDPWSTDMDSDFNSLLISVKRGLRGILDIESIGYYKNIADEKKESERKVRTVLRGISALMKNIEFLNPLRYGLFSWQLFSHKLCRWLVPFAMLLMLISNALLLNKSLFYIATFTIQLIFYTIAMMGLRFKTFSEKGFFKIPTFFIIVNLSILNAWYRYMRGDRILVWNPSER